MTTCQPLLLVLCLVEKSRKVEASIKNEHVGVKLKYGSDRAAIVQINLHLFG